MLTDLYNQETLKRMLVNANSDFYLLTPRTPGATYMVLWYEEGHALHSLYGTRCKVDILLPGIMNIPTVPPEKVLTHNGLPAMPLIPHLFLKLQAWADHRASLRPDQIRKQYTDVRDIDALLDIAVVKRVRIDTQDVVWVPASMTSAARERVKSYVVLGSMSSRTRWRALGFDV